MTQNSFRTTWSIPKGPFLFSHQQAILLMGSCFSDNIGAKLQKYKFAAFINPFGILFNPASIHHSLVLLKEKQQFEETDLLHFNEQWLSLSHHTRFSHPQLDIALKGINESLINVLDFIKLTERVVLTLGTAFAYFYKKTDTVVANCHKIPAKEFERKLLSLDEITDYIYASIEVLKSLNPKIKVLLTVSPVRHWKDGVLDNQMSKSLLHLGVREVVKNMEEVAYFPAYELMMDDLRDYRFYKPDMLHPNEIAVDYIWQKFVGAYMDASTQDLVVRLHKLNHSLGHRPRHPASKKHQDFVQHLLLEMETLQAQCPYLDFDKERKRLLDNLV